MRDFNANVCMAAWTYQLANHTTQSRHPNSYLAERIFFRRSTINCNSERAEKRLVSHVRVSWRPAWVENNESRKRQQRIILANLQQVIFCLFSFFHSIFLFFCFYNTHLSCVGYVCNGIHIHGWLFAVVFQYEIRKWLHKTDFFCFFQTQRYHRHYILMAVLRQQQQQQQSRRKKKKEK